MEKSDFSPLPRQALYANKRQWNQFLSIFLLAAGIGFTVTGIIFFFAYNWDELPKFAKLGMVEVYWQPLSCSPYSPGGVRSSNRFSLPEQPF